MDTVAITSVTLNIIETIAILVVVAAIVLVASRSNIQLGSLKLNFDRTSAEAEKIRLRLEEGASYAKGADKGAQQYALLREYHAQGLAQSKISFWVSLVFAAFGFAIIALSVHSYLSDVQSTQENNVAAMGKPIFSLISGTVIEAVAGLFFVQSNRSRELMVAFFDKLRTDRKLDESLKLVESISDENVSNRLKAMLAISYSEIPVDGEILNRIIAKD